MHVLDRALVARVRRADEEVVGDVDARDQRLEALRVAVGELLRRDALALGRLRDRLAVLVGAGEEEHLLAALAHVPREDVGADGGVRVTQVRGRVDVEDRRGDVVGHRRRRTLAAGAPRRCAPAPQADPHAAAHRAREQNRQPEPRRPRREDSNRGRSRPGRKRPRATGEAAPRRRRGGGRRGERRAAPAAARHGRGPRRASAATRRAAGPRRRALARGAAGTARGGRGEQRHRVDVAEAVARAADAEVQARVVARAGHGPIARARAHARAARGRRRTASGSARHPPRRRSAASRRSCPRA